MTEQSKSRYSPADLEEGRANLHKALDLVGASRKSHKEIDDLCDLALKGLASVSELQAKKDADAK